MVKLNTFKLKDLGIMTETTKGITITNAIQFNPNPKQQERRFWKMPEDKQKEINLNRTFKAQELKR
jgi:hypothetical protein